MNVFTVSVIFIYNSMIADTFKCMWSLLCYVDMCSLNIKHTQYSTYASILTKIELFFYVQTWVYLTEMKAE